MAKERAGSRSRTAAGPARGPARAPLDGSVADMRRELGYAREVLHAQGLFKAARFAALEDLLGDCLETRVLPDAAKNPQGNPFPHAVLTKDLIAEDGQPTLEAARDVLAFLSYRLKRSA